MWLADGSGILGLLPTRGGARVYGVIGADGWRQLGNALPTLALATGLERPVSSSGRTLQASCNNGTCGLVERVSGGSLITGEVPWTVQGTVLDEAVWAADGQQAWLLTTPGTGLVLVRQNAAGTVTETMHLASGWRAGSGAPPLILGILETDPAAPVAVVDNGSGLAWLGWETGAEASDQAGFAGWGGGAGTYPAP
jgi:hypothetical protein